MRTILTTIAAFCICLAIYLALVELHFLQAIVALLIGGAAFFVSSHLRPTWHEG